MQVSVNLYHTKFLGTLFRRISSRLLQVNLDEKASQRFDVLVIML